MKTLSAVIDEFGAKPFWPANATSSSLSGPPTKINGLSERKSTVGPVPVTPIPPTSLLFLKSGTPPGEPSSELPGTGKIDNPGCELNIITLPGFRNLLMSEKKRFDSPTPTSGPGSALSTPGGKCCWMMKPAVRELNAFWLLLK